MNTVDEQLSGKSHILDEVEIGAMPDWEQLLDVWYNGDGGRPLSLRERIAYLEVMSIRQDDASAQMMFFLDLADRYWENVYKSERGDCSRLVTGNEKKILRRKGFELLCQRLCPPDRLGDFPIYLPYTEPVISKIIDFIYPHNGLGSFDNLRAGLTGSDFKKEIEGLYQFGRDFTLNCWEVINGYDREYGYRGFVSDISPEPVRNHTDKIIMLMRRFDLLDRINNPQYYPSAEVFRRMVVLFFEEYSIVLEEKELDDGESVFARLKERVIGDDSFAECLFLSMVKNGF